MEIDIMFNDLTLEKQKELLQAAGITTPEEANWDVVPITTVVLEN